MRRMSLFILVLLTVVFVQPRESFAEESAGAAPSTFRLGVIGTDTSHVQAFVGVFNNPTGAGLYQKYQITAAYKGGMPDNPSSWDRIEKCAKTISTQGVTIYSTMAEFLQNVDGVLIECVDGRPHLEYAKPVIAAGKPMFIDKPMGGCLYDVVEIFRLAAEKNVPVFSASSLRYSNGVQQFRTDSPLGKIYGAVAWSPCSYESHHPDLYWYGVHGVETLFTLMGSGCVSVARTTSADTDVAVGLWSDGRIGSFRGIRKGNGGYGAFVFGEKGKGEAGKYDGYKPLCDQICLFFENGKADFDNRETLEIMAFMYAADLSKKNNGKAILIEDVIEQAKSTTAKTFVLKVESDGSLTLDGQPVTKEEIPAKVAVPAEAVNTIHRVVLYKAEGIEHKQALELIPLLDGVYFAGYFY